MRYELKTPCRDGATHILFESLDLIAKLAALAPKPRVNLTRFHCVFAPNSKHRVQVTPAGRGKGSKTKSPHGSQDRTPFEQRAAISRAQRLQRVFNRETVICRKCGGTVKVIACIEGPGVIRKILTHLKEKTTARVAMLPYIFPRSRITCPQQPRNSHLLGGLARP